MQSACLLCLLSRFVLTVSAVDKSGFGCGLDVSCWITSPKSVTMLYSEVEPFASSHLITAGFLGCVTEDLPARKLQRGTEMCLSWFVSVACRHRWKTCPGRPEKNVWMILLLLLLGNTHPNPGPKLTELGNPVNLKNSCGLSFIHANVRSLTNKIDAIRL